MKNTPKNVASVATGRIVSEGDRAAKVSGEGSKRVAVRKGMEAADKGRTLPHREVKAWLESWGADDELQPPECA